MFLQVIFLVSILLLAIVYSSSRATYELLVSDENLFSDCPSPAEGTLNHNGLFDFSNFSTSMNEEGVTLAGSMTSVWNIQPEDRVEMDLALLYFDRGNWQPTVFSLKSKDFCKSMYDEKQFWYKVWTGHVTNSKDVKDKCVHPGTKLEIEQYVLSLTTAVPGQLRSGRYRAQLSFNAFPQGETKRPPSICFEVVGDLLKL